MVLKIITYARKFAISPFIFHPLELSGSVVKDYIFFKELYRGDFACFAFDDDEVFGSAWAVKSVCKGYLRMINVWLKFGFVPFILHPLSLSEIVV